MSHAIQLLTRRPLRLSELITPLFDDYPDLDATQYSHADARGYVYPGETSTRGIFIALAPLDEDERERFEEQEDDSAPDGLRRVALPQNLHYAELTYHAMASPADVGFAVELARVGVERFGGLLYHEYYPRDIASMNPEWVREVASGAASTFLRLAQLKKEAIMIFGRRRNFYLGPWVAEQYDAWLAEVGSIPGLPDDQRAMLWLNKYFTELQQLDFAPPHRKDPNYCFKSFEKVPQELDHRKYPKGGRLLVIGNHRPEVTCGDIDYFGIYFDDVIPGGVLVADKAILEWFCERGWYQRMDEQQYATRSLTMQELMEASRVAKERGWENDYMTDTLQREWHEARFED